MVELGEANFTQWLPEIESAIRNASFIAVDLEFLGLPSTSHPKAVSLFDSPAERHVKICDSVRRFPPCQLGIACFKDNGDCFEADVFCIPLFKRLCKRVFSFSLSALTFLSQNHFDFNKFVGEGVSYTNRTEYTKLKREIISGTFDYDEFTDRLEHRMQMLKMKILLEATVEDERMRRDSESAERASFCRDERVRLAHPLLIELSQKECGEEDDFENPGLEQSDTYLWDNALTSIECASVVYVLSVEFPHFDFQIDHTRTLLYVAERPLIFRGVGDKKRHKVLLKTLLNEVLGVSRVFQCISENKKALVGHNSLLDMLYIYNSFEADLPDKYEEWKKALLAAFPTIIDTKVLGASLQETLSNQGVTDLSLQTLVNYFESPSCGSILPFETPPVVPGSLMPGLFEGKEMFHNAGYDALVTGQVFIKLAHLYAYTKCASPLPMRNPWPLQKLLIVMRNRITNKVPIPLIDTQHCNLSGEDPVGHRPDVIRLKKRRHLGWVKRLTSVQKLYFLVGRLLDYWLVPLPMCENECARLRDDLIRVMGAFRVELRRSACGQEAHIATNTAKSYARVCSIFTFHDDYYLADEDCYGGTKKTYEQRLTASREKKSRQLVSSSHNSSPFPSSKTTLSVTVAALSAATVVLIGKRVFSGA